MFMSAQRRSHLLQFRFILGDDAARGAVSSASSTSGSIMRTTRVTGFSGLGHPLLAIVMIGLGIIGLYTGDFAGVWQRIPFDPLPGRVYFAYATAVIELLTGVGLLLRPTIKLASAVLLVFCAAWLLSKVPAVVALPTVEATWLGFGEIGTIVAGVWIVWTRTRAGSVRWPRILFAVSLPMIGLSHFFYPNETAKFIPAYFPQPVFLAYLTGAGSLLTCVAILSGVCAHLAAVLETAMLVAITVFVWLPGLSPMPVNVGEVTGFLISSAIACGAWIVADSYRGLPWFARQAP
jgi:uncharacterized membrane protein